MNKILVHQVTGPQCGTDAEGSRLYGHIAPVFRQGQHIILDFEGVVLASSSFFNASVGKAFKEFGEEFVRKHIEYINLKPRLQFVLDRTLGAYERAV